jgi:hypothetical protein
MWVQTGQCVVCGEPVLRRDDTGRVYRTCDCKPSPKVLNTLLAIAVKQAKTLKVARVSG